MHRGSGATAVAIAKRAIEAMRANGTPPYEAEVIVALGLAQQGKVDEALAAAEHVAAEHPEHPFVMAATALCESLAGLPERAIEHAAAVAGSTGATYLDEVFALVASAGAAAQQGDAARAEAAARAAVARATDVGDVAATAFAATALSALTGHSLTSTDRTNLGEGWATVVRGLTRPA